MSVAYEWDVETVTVCDTADSEEGECLDHRHQASFEDAVVDAAMPAPDGCRFSIVLVRDDDEGRAWAYLDGGGLPEFFTDANGVEVHRVPKRFVIEVARAIAKLRLEDTWITH
jgi:hypothetical protein